MSAPTLIEVPLRGMVPLAQDLARTCWYTCYDMMFKWRYGIDNSPVIRTELSKIDIYDKSCVAGMQAENFKKAAKALGLSAWGFGQSLTACDFRTWLPHTPVWVAGRWYDYNHNVIVIGISDEQVKFIDPWWEVEKKASILTWPIDAFLHGNRRDRNGTDHFLGWYSCQVWKD